MIRPRFSSTGFGRHETVTNLCGTIQKPVVFLSATAADVTFTTDDQTDGSGFVIQYIALLGKCGYVCVCVCMCVRACVCACLCTCVWTCMRACVRLNVKPTKDQTEAFTTNKAFPAICNVKGNLHRARTSLHWKYLQGQCHHCTVWMYSFIISPPQRSNVRFKVNAKLLHET